MISKQEVLKKLEEAKEIVTHIPASPSTVRIPFLKYVPLINTLSDAIQEAIIFINNLEEEVIPTVPIFVDKWIKQHENYNKWSLLERFMCDYNNVDLPTALYNYYDNNKEGSRDKVIHAILNDYEVEGTPQWEVECGDLVIRKGTHEAKVYFVGGFDQDEDTKLISSILLTNGIKDEFYEDDIDYFFENYRLLAKKENLEKEVE